MLNEINFFEKLLQIPTNVGLKLFCFMKNSTKREKSMLLKGIPS